MGTALSNLGSAKGECDLERVLGKFGGYFLYKRKIQKKNNKESNHIK